LEQADNLKANRLVVGLHQQNRKGAKRDEVSLLVSGRSKNIKCNDTTFLTPPLQVTVLETNMNSGTGEDTTVQRTVKGYSQIDGVIGVNFLKGSRITLPPKLKYHASLKLPVSVVSGFFGCETHMVCVHAAPVTAPGEAPGDAPEAAPGAAPGAARLDSQAAAQGCAPAAGTVNAPGATPVSALCVAPGASPEAENTVVLYAAGECGKPGENKTWLNMFPQADIFVNDKSGGSKVVMLRIPRDLLLQRVIPVVIAFVIIRHQFSEGL